MTTPSSSAPWLQRCLDADGAAESTTRARITDARHLARQIAEFAKHFPDADDAELWLAGIAREAETLLRDTDDSPQESSPKSEPGAPLSAQTEGARETEPGGTP